MLVLEDDHASLEAALAFLDSCENDATDDARSDLSGDMDTALSSSSSNEAPRTLHSVSPRTCAMDSSALSTITLGSSTPTNSTCDNSRSSCDTITAAAATAMPAMHMRHDHATHSRTTQSVRAPRRRKSSKAEIAALRNQVQHLTVLLSQLELLRRKRTSNRKLTLRRQAMRCAAATTSPLPLLTGQTSSAAFDAAVRELQQLQTAKMLNLELRAKWREQIELAKCLEALVKKPMETIDMDLLVSKPLERPRVTLHHRSTMVTDDRHSPALAALDTHIEWMRRETPAIRAYLSTWDSTRVVTASRAYHDTQTQQQTLEFVTSTPFACSVATLQTHFWHQLAQTKDHHNKQDAKHRDAHQAGDPHKHDFMFQLACHFGEITLTGVSAVSKCDDQGMHIVTYTSALTLAGTDLRFRESVWLLMSEHACGGGSDTTKSLPRHALLQTCYRMQSGRLSARAQADASYFQDFVLHAQSERMRSEQLRLQTALLQTVGSAAAAAAARASVVSGTVDTALECMV